MARSYRRFDIINQSSISTILPPPTSLIYDDDELAFSTFDLLNPNPNYHPSFSLFDISSPFCDSITDLVQIEATPFCSYQRLVRSRRVNPSELYLNVLCDRLDRLPVVKREKKVSEVDRKYSWMAEIKSGVDRKYKWTAEIEAKGKRGERKYQWMTEIKGKDDVKRTYTWKATIGGEEKKAKKKSCRPRNVEIEERGDNRAVVLRQAFAKRAVAAKDKGKRKELSPQDAAFMIQMTFRAYLIRRSQALRAFRELAAAKTKLKELRALFHNYFYRSRVVRNAEDHQKISENIVLLLLTLDAIEGVDVMVRAAKRSMVDELEEMLEVVDPQPARRSLSMRGRTFDVPTCVHIQKEIAEGVSQVVELLDQENGAFEAFS